MVDSQNARWGHLGIYAKYLRAEMALYDEIMGMNEDIRLISDYCGISDRETNEQRTTLSVAVSVSMNFGLVLIWQRLG
jgi:hypothetical protein